MLRRSAMTPERLCETVELLRECDPELVTAIEREFPAGPAIPELASLMTGRPMAPLSIILRKGRPVLAVNNGSFVAMTGNDPEASVLLDRLEAAKEHLERCFPAVGRVEMEGNAEGELAGTAWLVAPDIVVTNAHVACKFALQFGHGFRFRSSASGVGKQAARIDFLAEPGNPAADEVAVSEVLWIAPDCKPDIAFLRLERPVNVEPIKLSAEPAQRGVHVAAIGYPVRNEEVDDPVLMDAIFRGLYTYKCLSPGMIRSSDGNLMHDCSTLRGSSGSPIIDLGSGEAVGLHYLGGSLDGSNHAVPSHIVASKLKQLNL